MLGQCVTLSDEHASQSMTNTQKLKSLAQRKGKAKP